MAAGQFAESDAAPVRNEPSGKDEVQDEKLVSAALSVLVSEEKTERQAIYRFLVVIRWERLNFRPYRPSRTQPIFLRGFGSGHSSAVFMFTTAIRQQVAGQGKTRGRVKAGVVLSVAVLLTGFLAPSAARAAEPTPVPWTTAGTDIRGVVSTVATYETLANLNGVVTVGGWAYAGSGSGVVRIDKTTGAVTTLAGSSTGADCIDAAAGADARFKSPTPVGFDGELLYLRDACGVRTVDPDTGATGTLTDVADINENGVPHTMSIAGRTLYTAGAGDWTNEGTPIEIHQRDLVTGQTSTLATIDYWASGIYPTSQSPYREHERVDVIVADDTDVWVLGVYAMHRINRTTGAHTVMPYPFNWGTVLAGQRDITYRGAGPYFNGQVISVGDYLYSVIPGFYDWYSVGRLHKYSGERHVFASGLGVPEGDSEYSRGRDGSMVYLSGLAYDGARLYLADDGYQNRPTALRVVASGVRMPSPTPIEPSPEPTPAPSPEPTPTDEPEPVQSDKYVALGDSYSSGYGMGDYDLGTNEEGGNDCQRSEHAYSKLVAETLGLDLSFHACQGAVSKHFYERRLGDAGNDWGELPQLEHITRDTSLLSFTIGGNDAKFADIYKECVDGWEVFRWNTCHEDDKVTVPLAKAFARLDGGGDNGDPELLQIHPYREIFSDSRDRSPFAQRVVVGYPAFFPAGGSDQSNCEGIDRVDQAWMHDKTLELNAIIKKNAELNGFRYVDPNRESIGFAEHGLCSEDSWFYGAFHAGQIHPRRPGHKALAKAIIEELTSDVRPSFKVMPHATAVRPFTVPASLESLYVGIEWPGSDIQLSLVSPSGQVYSRTELPGGAVNSNGPTWDGTRIPNPEAGVWTARMYGADVDPQGEEARLAVSHVEAPNRLPVGAFDVRLLGSRLELDGSRSSDSDGQVTAYRWYVKTDENAAEKVLEGQKVSLEVPIGKPVRVSLAVTDDEDATSYVTRRATTVSVDVKPGSVENPINLRSKGVTPLAILSTEEINASQIDVRSLRVGPKSAPAVAGVGWSDLNGDGRIDLTVHVRTQDLGLSASDTELGVSGMLLDGRLLIGSDHIRLVR